MKEKIHPFHARTTRIVMTAFFLLSAVPFIAVFYVANTHENLETLFSVLFMILFATGGLIAVARLFIGKCPECKSWLLRQKESDLDKDEVKFFCKQCSITWNSGLKVDR